MNKKDQQTAEDRSSTSFLLRVGGLLSIMTYGGLFAFAATSYLSVDRHPVLFAVAVISSCTLIGAHLFWRLTGWFDGWKQAFIIGMTFAVTVFLPASTIWPGSVTHSRFGMTVVGLQPVPVYDVSISTNGMPWFRYKNHVYNPNEVAPFDDAEVIVLATGWQDAVRLDEDLSEHVDARIIAQPTGEAVQTYNRLLNEGESVALLLHSTC